MRPSIGLVLRELNRFRFSCLLSGALLLGCFRPERIVERLLLPRVIPGSRRIRCLDLFSFLTLMLGSGKCGGGRGQVLLLQLLLLSPNFPRPASS